MIIIGIRDFLKYPEGTIFAEYDQDYYEFDNLCIKGRTVATVNFCFTPIANALNFNSSSDLVAALESAILTDKKLDFDLDSFLKDCEFDESRLFGIWQLEELKTLKNKLAVACEFAPE